MRMHVFAALVGACLATGPAMAAPTAAGDALSSAAAALVLSLTETEYRHENDNSKGADVERDGGKLDIETDCSGWVSYNLETTLPKPWYASALAYQQTFSGEQGFKHPRANVYQDLLSKPPQGAPFQPVGRLAEAKAGDILAWCLSGYCGGDSPDPQAKDSGHVMIVAGPPIQDDGGWFVLVMDSSEVNHWSIDSLPAAAQAAARSKLPAPLLALTSKQPRLSQDNGTVKTNGVGVGFIRFTTDAGGAITGFQFNQSASVHTTAEKLQFGLGRPAGTVN